LQRHSTIRLILISQIVCVLALLVLALQHWMGAPRIIDLLLTSVAILSAGVTGFAASALVKERRTTNELALSITAERRVSAELEQAVASRTMQLEDAQRVLQRMWWLGQQITLELNPQRVLDRFLEAVVDIVQADGGFVGLLSDDGKIKLVAGVGIAAPLAGGTAPIAGSMIGSVVRSGKPWTVTDLDAHALELHGPSYALIKGIVRSLGIVPISRRGERIGAVVVASKTERDFGPVDLARVEAMADLLSVSLENAELVETLRQAEWRFRTLFRAAPDAVLTVLQSGRIREANDAVREVTHLDPLQVVGREVVDLVIDADRERLTAALDAAAAATPQRIEVTFKSDQPATRRVVALAMTRLPEADPPTVLVVGRDMTAEREMRVRLMESDRLAAIGELVAGVAHEVNNPLSSISAFAQLMLRDGGLTPAQRESIEVIRAETVRASQVVKDLLAFARRSEPQREAIDLNALVSRTLRLRDYQLTSNKIKVDHTLSPDLPHVIGDARQIQQVCLNLVTNAIQAMATMRGGTLHVTTRAEARFVLLEMRDTGPGIPEMARAHIFEPFFTTKSEGEGTGLGLSVSYGIIAAHGGMIEVTETSPSGTTFRVSLPIADVDAVQHTVRESGLPHRSAIAGIRLLFVDDEAALRASVEAFGELRGFSVLVAADGLEALSVIRSTGVDAVVCDLRMPGMDGIAFHDRLRRERPGLAARTVFVTGDVVMPTRSGLNKQPVLSKPFSFDRLEEAVTAVMRGTSFNSGTPVRGSERIG
jgi:two-component system NtrC family sensor kinase